ncbi:hypothetical protein [Viridibacillus sp. FSL R5-0888]|uniref:hypothetical protein n=1 Tax=Viridibacillus sp. FSL R5-0888 TaxID=2921663 RepID=UPI0030FCD1D2
MDEQLQEFHNYYRSKLGFDISKPMTIKENMYWIRFKRARERATAATTPYDAITIAFDIDKPYFLEKWWNTLSIDEKQEYLIYCWLHNDSIFIHGMAFWIDRFIETGYLSNCDIKQPEEPIKLYRGCIEGLEDAMSWTNDIEIAGLYANQFEGSHVYKTIATKNDILSIFQVEAMNVNTHEKYKNLEYILNPKDLKIEVLE